MTHVGSIPPLPEVGASFHVYVAQSKLACSISSAVPHSLTWEHKNARASRVALTLRVDRAERRVSPAMSAHSPLSRTTCVELDGVCTKASVEISCGASASTSCVICNHKPARWPVQLGKFTVRSRRRTDVRHATAQCQSQRTESSRNSYRADLLIRKTTRYKNCYTRLRGGLPN